MRNFIIAKGLVIKWKGAVCEYISRATGTFYFRDVLTQAIIQVTEVEFWGEFRSRKLCVVEATSTPTHLLYEEGTSDEGANNDKNINQLAERWQEDADKKAFYMGELSRRGITCGQRTLMRAVLREIAKKLGDLEKPPAPSTVGKWMSKFEGSGRDITSVVSGFATKSRRKSTGPDHEDIIQTSIDDHYLLPTRPSRTSAYRWYRSNLETENRERLSDSLDPLVPISYRTYVRRIDERPKYEVDVARFGAQVAKRRYTMIEGHLPASHPLDYAESDHTPLNLFVIDDESYLPLGKPWLSAMKDRFSGMTLGLYLTFSPPSLQSTFGLLRHSLEGHHLATLKWPDIENPWLSSGLAATYVSDRGSDYRSLRYRMAIRSLGAEYQYCEVRTPWHKASIERFFGTVETTFLESLPGKTFRCLANRMDYDSSGTAMIRFSVLVYLLHKWAADFHNVFPNSRSGARPIDLWNEGIITAPPSLPANLDQLDVVLGNVASSHLSNVGLRYENMTYSDSYLRDLMKDLGPGAVVTFSVPANDLGVAYVLDPRNNKNVPVPNTRPDYASGLSLFQHKWMKKICREKYKKSSIDGLISVKAEINARVRDELAAKSTRSKTTLARLAGINSQATLSGEGRTILDPLAPSRARSDTTTEVVSSVSDIRRPRWDVI